MKVLASRTDADRDDIVPLAGLLGLTSASEVFAVALAYFNEGPIPARARFLIEEMFS